MCKGADPEVWKSILTEAVPAWVLFKHGTCVVVTSDSADVEAAARAVLHEFGPAHVATDSADFSVHALPDYPGWVVSCHHPDIITYVHPSEVEDPGPGELAVGLLGRSYRDRDSQEPEVVHLEFREQ
jgi:hypothetical protein